MGLRCLVWPKGIALATACLIASCENPSPQQEATPAAQGQVSKATYAGSESCQNCHQEQFNLWRGSHHELAMQTANEDSVLAPFSGESFDYFGVQSTFFKRDGEFFVTTDGADGTRQTYPVSHTFGVYPLQQYLVSFPDGRRQALGISWDSRPVSEGGGRWFHLYANEPISHEDVLHWTGLQQNWNFMCADCHSTALAKNYRPDTDSFDTTWSEMNVGCEACHGPASRHIENPGASDTLVASAELAFDLGICARCHSRREQLAEGYRPGEPWLDFYRPALLGPGLYFPDGQIQDEVYVYGSFLQSAMYRAGVVCGDCHDSHSGRLVKQGNELCLTCHGSGADTSRFPQLGRGSYDSSAHHFHDPHTTGGQCVACHMMERTYMTVDNRADHSFRTPRPDLSIAFNTPNPCTQCHGDRDPAWASAKIAEHLGRPPESHFASSIAQGRQGQPAAEDSLSRLAENRDVPGIVRATALETLAGYRNVRSEEAILNTLRDPDPLVRLGALRGAMGFEARDRWRAARHLLDDPYLAIRSEAGRILADSSRLPLGAEDTARLANGVEEYVNTQGLHRDRPEAYANIGQVRFRQGNYGSAQSAYEKALQLSPNHLGALINLADLYRFMNKDADGGSLLRRAAERWPDSAAAHQALALWLVRQGKNRESVGEFAAAARLEPENLSLQYAYGIALNSTGATPKALAVLTSAVDQDPHHVDILFALATIHRDQGNWDVARGYTKRLLELVPNDPQYLGLARELDRDDARTR